MKLCIPTNWDDRLLDQINDLNCDSQTLVPVHEIYGTLRSSVTGGGRPSSMLPKVTRSDVGRHVALAHRHGLEVNFLLNSICMGNQEFVPECRTALLETLGWLQEIRVDTVTITIPYLMELVKRQFPTIKVCVSVSATVGTVQEAQSFSRDIGVDRINLHFMTNRDFRMIEAIRKAIDPRCDLEVLANDPCVFHCAYREYHQALFAHGSQEVNGRPPAALVDYPGLKCAMKRIQARAEILKSPWIRPEDSVYWERAGVQLLKLAGREKPADWIAECANAYARRSFRGNIYDFVEKSGLCAPEYGAFLNEGDRMHPLRFHVDNRALDGFIEFFYKNRPRCELGCETSGCRHCSQWAERAVRVDEVLAARHLVQLRVVLDRLTASNGSPPTRGLEKVSAEGTPGTQSITDTEYSQANC